METFYRIVWLFFCYSFLGWLGETGLTALRERRYVDKSLLYGPMCIVYGLAGVFITIALRELTDHLFFLFLGSAIYATVAEWLAGHWLERMTHTRWWDYSGHRWNLEGYVCLEYSLLWGLLGMAAVKWLIPMLGWVGEAVPPTLSHILLWGLLITLLVDCLATALTLRGTLHRLPGVERWSGRMGAFTLRLGAWVLRRTERRIKKAHPEAELALHPRQRAGVFAPGCGWEKLFWLFMIGSFLGAAVETVFCRFSMGVWMSRSSVVWGDFSIVWGLALALASLLLYRYRDRSDSFLFAAGTLLGGGYEFFCSVFTQAVFGVVFWDYSHLPFNLAGRVNLLYCFFWGIAAVVWIKVCYPKLSGYIEKIPRRLGRSLTWVMAVFMACNMAVSTAALARCDSRTQGLPPQNGVEEYLDSRYGDERMEQIYPAAVRKD